MKTLKLPLIFVVALFVGTFSGCKKDGPVPEPEEQEPRTAEEFLNLSSDEQAKYSKEYLEQFLGKTLVYTGRHVSELGANGLPNGVRSGEHTQERSTVCEKAFTINMPDGLEFSGGFVTLTLDSRLAEENGCDVTDSPYKNPISLLDNTSDGLPFAIQFPDINEWVEDKAHQSLFQVLPFPFLDVEANGIQLLKYDDEYWYIYVFALKQD
ncbi:hypothetical protein [Parapedobacter sp. 10938]|uniref:hypothetical protein n=1 Tax=Parapedobacter flavus TaxID=3110225 RepID=UPI002DBB5433|nr:hypothetical protein [Parapedobacter sp. 10938]MEC3881815.1 hypothetical protein [Parapedobacter sp. 10938]